MHKIEEHIDQKWQFLKDSVIFVGCSGGLDSVVLVFLLNKLGFTVKVLHVNYQLRGSDSEKDASFVRDFCLNKNISFQQKTIDLGKELLLGGNLQEMARNVRYNWFNEALNKTENSFLAVAHHQNDQIETFFLNLSRKAGVMGLASMLEKNDRTVRPLLPFSKEEIRNYAIENEISWREDQSNSNNKYRRNFLRNTLLPLLNLQIPGLDDSVLTLIRTMQENQLELESKMGEFIHRINVSGRLTVSVFQEWSSLERVEFFRQLKQVPSLSVELTNISSAENGKHILLHDHPVFSSIVKQNHEFIFVKKENKSTEKVLTIEKVGSLPKNFTKNEIFMDANKIHGELKLRKWKIGDRIQPVGMKGSKLISDCIKDAHVSVENKSSILVVVDDHTIHWCVGLVVGRKAIASSESQQIIRLSIMEN